MVYFSGRVTLRVKLYPCCQKIVNDSGVNVKTELAWSQVLIP